MKKSNIDLEVIFNNLYAEINCVEYNNDFLPDFYQLHKMICELYEISESNIRGKELLENMKLYLKYPNEKVAKLLGERDIVMHLESCQRKAMIEILARSDYDKYVYYILKNMLKHKEFIKGNELCRLLDLYNNNKVYFMMYFEEVLQSDFEMYLDKKLEDPKVAGIVTMQTHDILQENNTLKNRFKNMYEELSEKIEKIKYVQESKKKILQKY